jgi:hypothetical protein
MVRWFKEGRKEGRKDRLRREGRDKIVPGHDKGE